MIGVLAFSSQPEASPCVPADVAAGLDLLARSRPLWPVVVEEWCRAVAGVQAFADRWDGLARGAGWSLLELYGLHRCAPCARLSTMGAGWLIARAGYCAVSVDTAAIGVSSWAGNRLRIYRSLPDPGAVLAWSLVPATSS